MAFKVDFPGVKIEILISRTMVTSLYITAGTHIPADCNTDNDRRERLNSRCVLFIYTCINLFIV
jgi:hypothetical protein